VPESRDVVKAAELDDLPPTERSNVVRTGVVTDLGDLPPGFRRQVKDSARRLAADLNEPPGE